MKCKICGQLGEQMADEPGHWVHATDVVTFVDGQAHKNWDHEFVIDCIDVEEVTETALPTGPQAPAKPKSQNPFYR